jgi:uncharacterized protein involved in exopolysaccharide biosynthesis
MFQVPESSPTAAAPPPPEGRPGVPIEPRRLVAAVRRGKRLVFGALAAGGLLGAFVAHTFVGREFTAEAVIEWVGAPATGGDPARELQSQVDAIKLAENLLELRERTGAPASLEALSKRLEVTSSNKSNVVSFRGTGDSPEGAARFVTAAVDVFLERRTAVRRKDLEQAVARTKADVEEARRRLRRAREAYDDFRAQAGVLDPNAESQAAIEHAVKMRAEADLAKAEAEAERARLAVLGGVAEKEPAKVVLSETEIHPGERKLAEAEAELAEVRARLGPDHPKRQAIEAEVASLRKTAAAKTAVGKAEQTTGRNPRLDAVAELVTKARGAAEAAKSRQDAYDGLARGARQRGAAFAGIDAEAAPLRAAVLIADKRLQKLEDDHAAAEDAVRAATSGFRVLAPAVAPDHPSKSLRRPIAFAFPILFALLTVVGLLARALRGLRVFGAAEVGFWSGLPVLGTTAWPRRGSQDAIVADLRAIASLGGTTLVLGATPDDAETAASLVRKAQPPRAKGASASITTSKREGPALRRVAREADRVVVLVSSGVRGPELTGLRDRLGRADALACLVVGAPPEVEALPDRVGDLAAFGVGAAPSIGMPAHRLQSVRGTRALEEKT